VSEQPSEDKYRIPFRPQIPIKLTIPTDYPQSSDDLFDVLVIGGGVVGLAVLRASTLAGYRSVLVEAEADLLAGASGSNSGIICTGVDAREGTLERALIRDSISMVRPFLKRHRVPYRECGSLVCQWEWDKYPRSIKYASPLAQVLNDSLEAGDLFVRKLTNEEVGQMEPNISPLCTGAVHIPGEILVDPWLFSIAMAAHARENGAKIITSFEYDPESSLFDSDRRIWTVKRKIDRDHMMEVHPVEVLRARAVVNASGKVFLWVCLIVYTSRITNEVS
jgi:glycerol-3-phosphate dehydrogenase